MQERLSRAVLRADLAPSYPDFINEAIREIQDRRSWICMKNVAPVTINPNQPPTLPGTAQVGALPADFKELQKKPAVFFVTSLGDLLPVEVITEGQQLRRVERFHGCPFPSWPPRVFLELNYDGNNTNVIGIVEPLTEAWNFQVRYYRYLAPLVEDGDTSPFITSWPEMVLAKSKAIAFQGINDSEADNAERLFEIKLLAAIRSDAHAEVSGRETRM